MTARNLLLILSDEHQARAMSAAGHPIVKTPNLDRLAGRGTSFTSAYTPCPICVPARASLATGQYVHEIGYWDNAIAYDGRIKGWGHRLQEAGVRVESIGKLHYRNETDPTGFDRQIKPMHIKDGIGQVWGSVRGPLPGPRADTTMLGEIGAGYTSYNAYDEAVRDLTVKWLADARTEKRPWMLFVGFVAPHFPLICAQRYLDIYPPDEMPLPALSPAAGYVRHPWLEAQEAFMQNEAEFGADDDKRRRAVSAYYGLVSMLDEHVGRILHALDETGLSESTEIPLIVARPGEERRVRSTPVNLIDLAPTFLSAFGMEDKNLPGTSLFDLADSIDDNERVSFSEYHAVGAPSGAFMIRKGRWKYHEYIGYPPELFDIENDPEETRNVAVDPLLSSLVNDMAAELRKICDPIKVDRRAHRAQAELVSRFGGREAAFRQGTPGATPPPD
jgi:choline-sulfatase